MEERRRKKDVLKRWMEGADGGRDCENSQRIDRERANESYGDKVCVGRGLTKSEERNTAPREMSK